MAFYSALPTYSGWDFRVGGCFRGAHKDQNEGRDRVSGRVAAKSNTPVPAAFCHISSHERPFTWRGIASQACIKAWGSQEAQDRRLESPICRWAAARPSSPLGPIWAPLDLKDACCLLCITSRCVMIHEMGPGPLAEFSFSPG